MTEKLPPLRRIRPTTSGSRFPSPWVAVVQELDFLEPLKGRFQLQSTGRVVERRDALDTFDLRFHRAGISFSSYTQLGRLIAELCPTRDGTALTSIYAVSTHSIPNFARDLPAGVVRNHIQQIAGDRRVQRLIRLKEEAERYNILNVEGKTVVRLELVRASAVDPTQNTSLVPLPLLLVLSPLRGYQSEFEEVVQFAEDEHGLKQSAHNVIELGLQAIGWKPKVYSTRPEVSMCDSTPTAVVALRLLSTLFEVMRANEEGVRRDLDMNYLYDFRVVVRRAHCLLHAFRGQFKSVKIKALEGELTWLDEVTGPTRDLDVQLLSAREKTAGEKRRWVSVVKTLMERREWERHRLSENLNSERYSKFLLLADRVMEKLGTANSHSTQNRLIIGETIPGVFERSYQELLDGGRSLRAQTSAQEVRRLLNASQYLRYLIEFFQPLYDSQPTESALLAISKLQDELGAVNDTFARNELLEEIKQEMQVQGEGDSQVAASIGRLQEQFPRARQEASAKVWQAFVKFDLPENRNYFEAFTACRGPAKLSPREMQVGVEAR